MAQFIPFDENVEVNGQTILSVVNGVSPTFRNKIKKVLTKNGIIAPTPSNWYLQKNWLLAFKEIYDTIGSNTLFSIGKSILDNADFPDEIDNLEKALLSIDVAYKMNHRGGKIGYYNLVYFDETDRTAQIECKNPYPCFFDKGIIIAIVRRFKPEDSIIHKVNLAKDKPSRLEKGEDTSWYNISW